MKTQIQNFITRVLANVTFVTLNYVSFHKAKRLHDLWIRHSEIQLNSEIATDRLLSKETALCPVPSMARAELVCASIQH